MSSFNIICCFSVMLLISTSDSRKKAIKETSIAIEPDIPQKSDLETYLISLEKTVNFYIKNPNDIDVNSVFGFFLMNVNLNSVLRTKAQKLPLILANRFKNLVEKNKRIVAYFRMMASQTKVQTPRHKKLKKLATLFSNESFWISHTKVADNQQVVDAPPLDYKDILVQFSSWPEYKQEIDNGRLLPPFGLTEKCLVILAENPVNDGKSPAPKCIMPQECVIATSTGNDIGLGLVNRLLILIQARFSRHCSVISEEEDATLVDKLCSSCFREGLFISMNNFDPLMLLMEQITLCSLNGNVEFLRRQWIYHFIELQTQYGCFAENTIYAHSKMKPVTAVPPSKWTIDGENLPNSDTHCVGVASAAATAIISAAIKFILEMYM